MIRAFIREFCSGGLLYHNKFDFRVPRKVAGEIGSELYDLLYEVDISE